MTTSHLFKKGLKMHPCYACIDGGFVLLPDICNRDLLCNNSGLPICISSPKIQRSVNVRRNTVAISAYDTIAFAVIQEHICIS